MRWSAWLRRVTDRLIVGVDLRRDKDKNLAENVNNKVLGVDLARDITLPRVVVGPNLTQGVAKGK